MFKIQIDNTETGERHMFEGSKPMALMTTFTGIVTEDDQLFGTIRQALSMYIFKKYQEDALFDMCIVQDDRDLDEIATDILEDCYQELEETFTEELEEVKRYLELK